MKRIIKIVIPALRGNDGSPVCFLCFWGIIIPSNNAGQPVVGLPPNTTPEQQRG